MCGICGELNFEEAGPTVSPVAAMTASLKHRGPDAMGFQAQGNTALGHRRLKVIDLSERAHQPMVDNHLGLTIYPLSTDFRISPNGRSSE